MVKIPRVVIAAPASGSGKTTIATGLMAALGDRVAPFKIGPDYIDPGYHALATGRPGRNLDPVLVGEERILPLFAHGAAGAEIAVIEGVMGLFDGRSGTPGQGSTAHVARLLKAPVLLVVDARGQGRSLAALLHGFRSYEPNIQLAGVILNQVSTTRHEQILREACEEIGLPALGAVPRGADVTLPSRHLGLIPAAEHGKAAHQAVKAMAQLITRSVDLPAIRRLAATAGTLTTTPWDPATEVTQLGGPVEGAAQPSRAAADITARPTTSIVDAQPSAPRAATQSASPVIAAPPAKPSVAAPRNSAVVDIVAQPADSLLSARPGESSAAARSASQPGVALPGSAAVDVAAPRVAAPLGESSAAARPVGQVGVALPGPAVVDVAVQSPASLLAAQSGVPSVAARSVGQVGVALSGPAVVDIAAHPSTPLVAAPPGMLGVAAPSAPLLAAQQGTPGVAVQSAGPVADGPPATPLVGVQSAGPCAAPSSSALGVMPAGRHHDSASLRRSAVGRAASGPVVGVAGGAAFTFGYAEHLELLAAAGAWVVVVDPLNDESLPGDLSALILPGGFPEQHVASLSENTRLRDSVARFARSGGIVQAECGGLLYLLDQLDGHPMCGVLPGSAEMTGRLTLGYRDAVAAVDSVGHRAGERRTGHEFHRTRVTTSAQPAWHWRDHDGRPQTEGIVSQRVHASYLHTHPAGYPESVARLVQAATKNA